MRITFEGGLNENQDAQLQECQAGYNFELGKNKKDLTRRPSLDLKGTSTLGGSISGIMQLIKKDNTETTLVFDDDGITPTIYKWNGSSTFTSERTNSITTGSLFRDCVWNLDDYLIISDVAKLTPMLKWDGTSCTRLKTGLNSGSTQSVSSITRSGSTATVTTSGVHGYNAGDLVNIAGANETAYNGEIEILTVPSTTTFTYTVSGSPATPATGTITVAKDVDLYAKYAVVHDNRLWLFNVTATNDTPHLMVASLVDNSESFDTTLKAQDTSFTTGNEAFYMLTPDLKPINGVALFNKKLIISTKEGRLFVLTGWDSTNYQWDEFYPQSCCAGNESIVNIGNDVMFMRNGGNIELLSAVATSGDNPVDDVSRWISTTVQDMTGAITCYDQKNQKVLFFTGSKVLVFFKVLFDNPQFPFSPWSVYTTNLTFGFSTNAVKYLRVPGGTTYTVYVGDSTGNIYDMNGSGSGDNSTAIELSRTTNIIEADPSKILSGRVQYRRNGNVQLYLEFDWNNSLSSSNVSIDLQGTASDTGVYFGGTYYFGGTIYFGQGFKYSGLVSTQGFSPGGRDYGFKLITYVSTTVDFNIDFIDL